MLSRLEQVVGKNVAALISNAASTLARQESLDLDSPTSQYSFWSGSSGPNFVRSDSILADDDYVPCDAPPISKYGPISRMHKDNVGLNQTVQVSVPYRDAANSMVSIGIFASLHNLIW